MHSIVIEKSNLYYGHRPASKQNQYCNIVWSSPPVFSAALLRNNNPGRFFSFFPKVSNQVRNNASLWRPKTPVWDTHQTAFWDIPPPKSPNLNPKRQTKVQPPKFQLLTRQMANYIHSRIFHSGSASDTTAAFRIDSPDGRAIGLTSGL